MIKILKDQMLKQVLHDDKNKTNSRHPEFISGSKLVKILK